MVLGEAKGRRYTPEELTRKFSRALFPRTTNPYGCVTLHSYHFYVEQGVPQTQVLLWVYGEQLRAVLDNVVLAEYRRYDWRTHKVTEIRDGVFYPTRFASPQGALMPLTPQESLVLYRPQTRRRQALQVLLRTAISAVRVAAYRIRSAKGHTGVTEVMARFVMRGPMKLSPASRYTTNTRGMAEGSAHTLSCAGEDRRGHTARKNQPCPSGRA